MTVKVQAMVRRLREHEGATAVEYGIMVALIAVVIIAAVFFIGQELREDFSCVGSALDNSTTAGSVSC